MLYALDLHTNQLVAANQATSQKNLLCPGCHSPVILRKGAHKVAHFAHYRHSCHTFTEGETQEHLQGKQLLVKQLQQWPGNTTVEAVLPQLSQQPDVLYQDQDYQLALEYQCSPLATKRLIQRSRGYHQHGFQYCWLLGRRYQIKHKLTAQIAQFIRWHQHLGYYLLYIEVGRAQFEVLYNIQMADFLPLRYFCYRTSSFEQLQQFMHEPQELFIFPITPEQRRKQLYQLERTWRFPSRHVRNLQNLCYQRQQNLLRLGPEFLATEYEPPFFAGWAYAWRLQRYLGAEEVAQRELYQQPFIKQKEILEKIIDKWM